MGVSESCVCAHTSVSLRGWQISGHRSVARVREVEGQPALADPQRDQSYQPTTSSPALGTGYVSIPGLLRLCAQETVR